MIKPRNGQSMLEYAILIITVAAAVLAMNVYLRRAVNARLDAIEQEISPSIIVMGQ